MGLSHPNTILFPLLLLTTLFVAKAAACGDVEKVRFQARFELAKHAIARAKALYPKCRDIDEDKIVCDRRDKAYEYMDSALEMLKDGGGTCPICPDPDGKIHPIDCSEILKMGHKKSGVYTIWPKSRVVSKSISVYCDMETDGGGWTVIQRRGKFEPQISFYNTWEEYKSGFGHLEKEFWLGNDNILTLTNQGIYSLRVDLKSSDGKSGYSVYDSFWIGDEWSNYVLHVENGTGDVNVNLIQQHGSMFSTKDRQNDQMAAKKACAVVHEGAWWYPIHCGYLNLNGVYMPGVNNQKSNYAWSWLSYVGMQTSEMKIRHRYANA